MILYEYFFNGHVWAPLRLGDLFGRLGLLLVQKHPLQRHVTLTTLFEVVGVAGRADLKSDLLKGLDRQRQTLITLRANPQVDQDALDAVISELETALGNLTATYGKVGQLITDNEWLMSIRSRTIIPGGTCELDLLAYFARQHHPAECRRADIVKWAQPLVPLRDATMIVLRLLREPGQSDKVIVNAGSYQQMLPGRVYQLTQVCLGELTLGFIPETSTNKYMLWVCSTQQDGDLRLKPVDTDILSQLKLRDF